VIKNLGPVDLQLFTDGSTLEGTQHGGADLVVMRGNDCLHQWNGPTGRWISSFLAEKSAMQQAFAWLEEATSRSTALVLCDCKPLVEALKNSCTTDVGIRTTQSAAEDLRRKDKSVLVFWIPGHCNVSDNDLADAEAKAGSLAEQPTTAPDADTRKAIIRRINGLPSLTHPCLLQLYTTAIKEVEGSTLSKHDRSDVIRFRRGNHPELRRWQTLVNKSESTECRLCGEDEESAEHLWLQCPARDAAHQRLDLGRSFDELIRLPTTDEDHPQAPW